MSRVVSFLLLPLSLIKFLLVGVINTAVGLSAIYLLKWRVGAGDAVANLGGYSVGLTISFILNKRWTFRYVDAALPAAIRFIAVFAVAYLANLGTVLILIHWFRINEYFAQAAGVPPYTILFYLGSRHVAFRSTP